MEDLTGLSLVKEFGFAGIIAFLWFILLRQQQKKMFEQSDSVIKFSTEIVSGNIKALTEMHDVLKEHVNQKDRFIEVIKECSRERDERLHNIEEEIRRGKENGSIS